MELFSLAGLGISCFFLTVTAAAAVFIVRVWKDFDDTGGGHK